MQLHDFLTYQTPESRQSSLWSSLSASSSALTLPRNPAKFSLSSFSLDCFQLLRGKTLPPTDEALLPPPADDYLVPGLDDPNSAVRHEPFPGSEYPSSLPACATVQAVLSARPSGAPDWVGFQDLYGTARGIIDYCEGPIFVRPLRRHDFPIRGTKRDDTSSPAICCVLMETRHKGCCLFLFSPSSMQDVGSRSISSLGVPFTSGLGLLFLSTTTRWLPV